MTVPHHRALDTGVVGVLGLCRAGRREAVPAASDEPGARTCCGPGRYVCRDRRTNGAVPGAPVSGTRAARETPADPARS